MYSCSTTGCDWLVIGSGFAGISAAKRLTELRSGDKIILIDAIGIGEGAAGQNSGFMIDVPHNINAKGDYLIEGIEKALEDKSIDFRIFGKPILKSYRRMGVILAENLENAKAAAKKISVKSKL